MHRTGHWLGMDVHDVGDYRVRRQSRPSRRRATSRGGAGVTIDGGGEEGRAGKTPYFPIMTSEALMTAQASSPFFS